MKRILHTALAIAVTLLLGVSAPQYASATTSAHPATQSQVAKPLNINSASADELAHGLKGIGPAKANAIVAYRKAHGPFHSVNELANVKGIGQATIGKNRSLIRLQ